jgi:hypothetical protein
MDEQERSIRPTMSRARNARGMAMNQIRDECALEMKQFNDEDDIFDDFGNYEQARKTVKLQFQEAEVA